MPVIDKKQKRKNEYKLFIIAQKKLEYQRCKVMNIIKTKKTDNKHKKI